MPVAFRPYCWMILLPLLFRSAAAGGVELKVIPVEASANDEVTVMVNIPKPEEEIEIRLLAKRIDSDNDGVLDQLFQGPKPTGWSSKVKDMTTRDDYAKDRNPQPRKIDYLLRCPNAGGDYYVEVSVKGESGTETARAPLTIYAVPKTSGRSAASALGALPKAVPEKILHELLKSLRPATERRPEQPSIWMVNAASQKTPLSTNGCAKDPQWAPAGVRADWVAYAFAQSRDAPFNIWTLNSKNPEQPQRITGSDGDDFSPVWSPDASSIAFVRGKTIMTSHMGSHPAKEAVVVSQPGIREILCWDAPSRNIIYSVATEEGLVEIWSANVETGTRQPLAYNPLWALLRGIATSERRDRLLLEWQSRTTGGVEIFALDFPGPTSLNLTKDFRRVRCLRPSLSADGSRVAFVVLPIE